MYSIDEAKKAIADKELADLDKEVAYLIHCDNVRLVKDSRLPYKALKEHNKEYFMAEQMMLNEHHSKHGEVVEFIVWLRQTHPKLAEIHDSDELQWLNFILDTKKGVLNHSAEFEALEAEWRASQPLFNKKTPEGIAMQKKYTARFLDDYDIDSLTEFDLFGTMNHTQEQIEQFKSELMELQTDFRNNPQNYFTETILLLNGKN